MVVLEVLVVAVVAVLPAVVVAVPVPVDNYIVH